MRTGSAIWPATAPCSRASWPSAIDDGAIDRITTLYREDERFHDAADAYLTEFETLLARAREGDGGGLLTSTIAVGGYRQDLSAIAYALGRAYRRASGCVRAARAHKSHPCRPVRTR